MNPTTAEAPPEITINPWIVAITVMFGTFMEVLDTTVVNVSLPHIAGSMSASTEEATWTLTSYLVSNAIILPITGWLARFFGRKRLLTLALIGFTSASLLCGASTALWMLIVFRVIQGATGGVLQPLSQAAMLEAFPPADRGKAMAFWGLGIVVAPMLGPVLGGWLTENYSWRWVFYINVPVGVVAVIMTRLFIVDPHYLRNLRTKIDAWGIGMLALGVAAVQILLDKGEQLDWFSSTFIRTLAISGGLLLVIFVVWELTHSEPVVDLRLFKIRTYSTGVFLMMILGFVLYGSLVALPLFLQIILRYPAVQAGLAMLPRGLGSFIGMPVTGFIMGRVDPRKLLGVGIVGTSLTLIALSRLNLNTGYWDLFWPQFLQGVSMSLLFVPLTTITMDPIPKDQMGYATSLFNFMRNVGGSIGIATATTMIARDSQRLINVLGTHVNPYNHTSQALLNQLRQQFIARGSDPVTATREAYAAAFGMVQQQAALISYLDAFRFFGAVFLFLLPAVLLMKRPESRKRPPPMH